jgi:hypothetical protein
LNIYKELKYSSLKNLVSIDYREQKDSIKLNQGSLMRKSIGISERTKHWKGEFLSNIFIRPKKDGTCRLILNLKGLNESVEYKLFKMEHLQNAITRQNCFMASIYLKYAYYSMSVNENHRKVLRFIWKVSFFSLPACQMASLVPPEFSQSY